jgi:hypothetical protein
MGRRNSQAKEAVACTYGECTISSSRRCNHASKVKIQNLEWNIQFYKWCYAVRVLTQNDLNPPVVCVCVWVFFFLVFGLP